ncbi:MAG: 3-octaprenyl-4-hydroxybenzoate carboxy-lyase partner protein [Pseudomonadota bacterium]|jgi:4-hydroxy-3-polyprenylbenzoate decarboxylase|nr:UbiX family flavin prenyltransferase [Polynucleobacter sp.]NBY63810.1 UbiX family flavin prenyltransferase [Betaproteobacteria bacterium]
MDHPKRLIVGISGASGIVYGVRILQALYGSEIETHLVMSDSAKLTLSSEMDLTIKDVESLASVVHNNKNIGATIASGSFKTLGMVIAPCSIRSLSEVAWGTTTSLLSRAADVVLKERRRLVLMVRETPLHLGHLRSMTQATENGAVIMPPVPMFYSKPETIDDIVNHTTGRCLDLFEIDTSLVKRWSGMGKQALSTTQNS